MFLAPPHWLQKETAEIVVGSPKKGAPSLHSTIPPAGPPVSMVFRFSNNEVPLEQPKNIRRKTRHSLPAHHPRIFR
jgi:hypothetical protein